MFTRFINFLQQHPNGTSTSQFASTVHPQPSEITEADLIENPLGIEVEPQRKKSKLREINEDIQRLSTSPTSTKRLKKKKVIRDA